MWYSVGLTEVCALYRMGTMLYNRSRESIYFSYLLHGVSLLVSSTLIFRCVLVVVLSIKSVCLFYVLLCVYFFNLSIFLSIVSLFRIIMSIYMPFVIVFGIIYSVHGCFGVPTVSSCLLVV